MKFLIDPNDCLIVNAFSQVPSLRGAAALLGMDPAALVRKVQRISHQHGFLQKIGNRWTVTESGQRVVYWTEELINSQNALANEVSRLRLSAYAWLTEEMLVPNFKYLDKDLKKKYKWTFEMTGSDLEKDLLQNRTDFVIQGKSPNDPSIAHRKISIYPWVAVAPYSWRNEVSGLTESKLKEFLNSKSFCRHSTLNPMTVLNFSPELVHALMIDGVIGLRSAVVNELGWSAIPAMAAQTALKEKKIIKLNLPISYKDDVSIWWIRSRKDSTAVVKSLITWIQSFDVL
jgi:DNA-binding transcriptional LysR family regulator